MTTIRERWRAYELEQLAEQVAPLVEGGSGGVSEGDLTAALAAIVGGAGTSADTLGEVETVLSAKMDKSANLGDVANAGTSRSNLGLGTAATHAHGDYEPAGAVATEASARSTADALLVVKSANLSDLASIATARTNLGLALGTDVYSKSAVDAGFQPLDADLTSIAALTTTSFGRALLALADAATARDTLAAARRSATWVTGVAYKAGEFVVVSGQPWVAVDDHTAGATFAGDSAHWTLVIPGTEIATMPLGANFAIPLAFANVTDSSVSNAIWQVVVPANSGPVRIEIPSVMLSISTGSGTAAGTSYNCQLRILDDADVQKAHGEFKPYSTATAVQVPASSIALCSDVIANNGSSKTYRVQGQCQQIGTNSATAAVNTSSGGITSNPQLIARRV